MTRSLFASTLLAACSVEPELPVPGIADLLPTSADVSMQTPAPDSTSRSSAELDTFYAMTRSASSGVNGFAENWLDIIHDIVSTPASEDGEDRWVWGPFHQGEGGLAPTTEYFVAEKESDGTWTYYLLEADRSADDDLEDFSVIVAGRILGGTSVEDSYGFFAVDFDTAAALDPMRDTVGFAVIAYDFSGIQTAAFGGGTMVVAGLHQVASGDETPIDASYGYYRLPSGAGVMDLYVDSDIGSTEDPELWDVRSRWTAEGEGRADGQVTGGDLGETVVTISDCWDTSYATVYQADDQGMVPDYGDESLCAFDEVSLPGEFPAWVSEAIEEP